MRKKIFKFSLLFAAFVFFSCGAPPAGKPFSDITGETVYDIQGNPTSITGDAAIGLDAAMMNAMALGFIKDGKTELFFPDLSDIPGLERRFEKISSFAPEIKVEPPDAEWFRINLSNPIYIFTNEEKDSPAGNISNNPNSETEKAKQHYTLELADPQGEIQSLFVYFPKDVTAKGTGKSPLAAFDIDIKASKGWNKVYVKSSRDSGLSVKTDEKNASGLRWTAAKTNRF